MVLRILRSMGLALGAFAVGSAAMAAGTLGAFHDAGSTKIASAPQMSPPLEDWAAPQFLNLPTGVTSTFAGTSSKGMEKAALTLATFVPIAPCRLVDTRGVFSPVYAGGAYAAGEIRVYRVAGNCGVPAGTNRVVAVSLAITTPPTGVSGDIEVIKNGATLGGTVAMVIQAGTWNSVSTQPGVDGNGDFQVQLRGTPGDVVIDVNGFYAVLDAGNTSDSYNVHGRWDGDGGLLNVQTDSPTGGAIRAFNSVGGNDVQLSTGANAIDVKSGQFRVRGAGVNSSTMAFIHLVDISNPFGVGTGTLCDVGANKHVSIINHPVLNGNPNAIFVITPRVPTTQLGGQFPQNDMYYGVYIDSAATFCVAAAKNHWSIVKADNSPFVANVQFSVWVVAP